MIFQLEQTAAEIPTDDWWLDPAEGARLSTLRIPKRRADWRLGRWTAKRAVAAYLHLPPDYATIEIRPAESGAPEVLLAGQPAPCAISISHRDGIGLCAIAPAGTALGCDLELVEPRSDAFVADYFTPAEQSSIVESNGKREQQIALIWSAKESALKAMQVGLRADTRSVEVTVTGSTFTVRETEGAKFHGSWRLGGNLIRTFAVRGPTPEIECLPR